MQSKKKPPTLNYQLRKTATDKYNSVKLQSKEITLRLEIRRRRRNLMNIKVHKIIFGI